MKKQRIICSGMAALLSLGIMLPAILTATPTEPAENTSEPKGKESAEKKPDPKTEEKEHKKILNDAFDKMTKTQGCHFAGKRQTEFLMAMGGRAVRAETPFSGIVQNPGKTGKDKTDPLTYMAYQTGSMGQPQKYEIYQQGDRKFVRNLTTDERVDPADTMRQSPTPLSLIIPVIETLENHKPAGEEKIDGTECQVIETTIGRKGADHIVSLQPTMMPLPAANRTYHEAGLKMWLTKKDKIIRKIIFLVDSSTGISEPGNEENKMPAVRSRRKVYFEVVFFDYDKNVMIDVPDDVKDALEIKTAKDSKE